ncbi:MAG: ATP-grasp domain-containing protein [Methylococcaceae bacterium]
MPLEFILIVASSARMLAKAARNAGLKPLVIDLFADIDTQSHAEAFCQIPSLSQDYLTSTVDYFIKRYSVKHVIYACGFEYYPESLRYLDSRLTLLGNRPDTFEKLQNKPVFFSTLDKLKIPYPDVAFTAPNDTGNWLVKPMQGQGGVGIKTYKLNDTTEPHVYWQKFQPGTQHSVLFLADGQHIQVIGFNTQWTIRLSENQEFIFSGIINSCDLPDQQKLLISNWLKILVPVFELKGLNSMDFIQFGGKSYVLEINPRPSASMQLYDDDLLMGHIKAIQGELANDRPVQSSYAGYQIVYARQDITIPEGFAWPEWCMNLPESGDMCRSGQPICSIIAHQNEAQSVLKALQHNNSHLLKGLYPHGIHS